MPMLRCVNVTNSISLQNGFAGRRLYANHGLSARIAGHGEPAVLGLYDLLKRGYITVTSRTTALKTPIDHEGQQHVRPDSAVLPATLLIQEELQRVLAGSSFHSSKRCSEFLSFVIQETLAGRKGELKERTIGVALFGRDLCYDTAGDPIVRVKANEVRKRLAQYYGDHSDGSFRIDLAPGSYVPVFRHADLPATIQEPPAIEEVDLPQSAVFSRRWAWWKIALSLCVLFSVIASASLWPWHRASPLDTFWTPALHSDETPILCVGASSQVWLLSDRLSAQMREVLAQKAQSPNIAINSHEAFPVANGYFSQGSVRAALELSAFLTAKGSRAQLRIGSPLSLDDFHNHSIVAVGAFSNPWTLEKISEMRFRFNQETVNGKLWLSISDSQNPENPWKVQESPFETPTVDYALVTRMFDPESKTVFVSLAGLNQFGTEAAEEFVTNSSYWDALIQHAPRGWQSKNMQVVLQTSVVESRPTPPRIVAFYFW